MNNLIVSSPAFENKGLIPIEYTGYGSDISPELVLTNLDETAKSIVIIMDDMGHPIPAYNHWVIWNIPVMSVIPSSIPHGKDVQSLDGALQGIGYGKHRYRGPKPPFNWSHEYQFNVYVSAAASVIYVCEKLVMYIDIPPCFMHKKTHPKVCYNHKL